MKGTYHRVEHGEEKPQTQGRHKAQQEHGCHALFSTVVNTTPTTALL